MPIDFRSSTYATRARLGVLALLCTLSFVLYMDRVCIGQAATPIKNEFGLSNTQFALVLNSFLLGYAFFEVPTGRWGDRYGSRRVLARIAVWWSAFTALTGASLGLTSLLVTRFMFGAGEAGAFPNAGRVIRRWFPPAERGRVQGLMLASAGLGATLAPIAAGSLIEAYGWRAAFIVFGAVGSLWVVAFLQWFYDEPADHPGVNAAELELLQPPPGEPTVASTDEPIPWVAFVGCANVWLLGAITGCGAFCSYLYYSWYPTYLQEGHGVSQIAASRLSSIVLVGNIVGLLMGGVVADWSIRSTHDVGRSRRGFGFVVMLSAAVLLIVGVQFQSPWMVTGLLSSSALFMTLQNAIWGSTVMEIGGRHLGSLFGVLNMMGVAGGFVSQFYFAAIADWRSDLGYTGREQWNPAFYAYAVVLLLGGLCWLLVDPNKRIDP